MEVGGTYGRGVNDNLVNSSLFETTSQEEALDYLNRACDRRFDTVHRAEQFHLTLQRTDYGPWTSATARFGSGSFRCEPDTAVAVCRLRSGRARLTASGESTELGTGDLFVMAETDEPITVEWLDADCAMFRLPADAVRTVTHHWAPATHGSPLRFLSRRPATRYAGRRLAHVAAFAERHLVDGDPTQSAVILEAVSHLLAATVLATFPNTLVPGSSPLRPRADVPTALALALDFIARNADLPISVSAIATHAMVSERALQMAFHDHLSTTPATYLRHYRLARIHDELVSATPGDGTSVTEVAARWKFTESSRFTAHYRRIYGELPSRTLRQAP